MANEREPLLITAWQWMTIQIHFILFPIQLRKFSTDLMQTETLKPNGTHLLDEEYFLIEFFFENFY